MLDKVRIILSSLKKSKYLKDTTSKKVYIVFAGIIGDTVCFLPTIKRYIQAFPESKGYEITYFIKPAVHKFLNAIKGYSDLHIVELDYTRFCTDFQYYKEINNKYFDVSVSHVICPQKSISSAIVALNIDAVHKYGIEYRLPCRDKLKKLIFEKAFNEKVLLDANVTMMPALNAIANAVDNSNKATVLPFINSEKFSNPYGNYCVIGPYSSVIAKEWEIEKFADIANRALDRGINIVLVGTTKDDSKIQTFLSLVKSDRVFNLINKTPFAEWIDIIRNAKLVVSCDSAAIHIAAGVNTPSVCISGGMDEGLMYPYVVDELETGQHLPIVIMSPHEDCFKCRRIGEYYGYGNKACRAEIEKNKPMLCIQKITVDRVWESVNSLLKEQKL